MKVKKTEQVKADMVNTNAVQPRANQRKPVTPRPERQKFSDDQIIECFDLMAEEGLSLKNACKRNGLNYGAIRKRVRENENLSSLDARAREAYMRVAVERMNEIAEDESRSEATRKLLCDNIKWEAARVGRKIYGDRVQIDQSVKIDIDVTPAKDRLRQMLDIKPEPLTIENKP